MHILIRLQLLHLAARLLRAVSLQQKDAGKTEQLALKWSRNDFIPGEGLIPGAVPKVMSVALIEPFDRWFLSLSKGSGTTRRND